MNSISRRILALVGGGLVVLAAYAVVYQWGMATFEGETVSYVQALQVVLESLTTAGFGGNAPWSSTTMNVVVIAMNLTGVLLVFFTIPFFVVPLLESVFQTTAPTTTSLSDHVIVCADSPRETALRAELDAAGARSLFVKSDADLVRDLVGDGVEAIHGDPETTRTLERANVGAARALVADVDDEANANIILAARRLAPDIEIVSVVEDSATRTYHEHAGADEVVRPRVVAGEQLATKAQGTRLREELHEAATAGGIELTEVLIEKDSEFVGHTLSECRFREAFGFTVLGGWFHGEFVAPLAPDRELVEHTVLLVVGEPDPGRFTTLGRRSGPTKRCERVVVAGHGVVGRTVAGALTADGVDVTVVDREPGDGVDVVGDITDQETLRDADVAGADNVVLALSRDSLAVFSTLVIEEYASDVELLARADDVDYVQRCYDAGVEYTLALSGVTAHMVTARLSIAADDHVEEPYEVLRTTAPGLTGQRLGDAGVRARMGATVVAVERDGALYPHPDPGFTVESGDALILFGNEGATADFARAFGDADSGR